MILAIDIGNTTVALAMMKEQKVVRSWRVLTFQKNSLLKGHLKKILARIKKQHGVIESVVICSVVPRALKTAKAAVRDVFNQRPLIIGEDIAVPIKNRYRHPQKVGKDRLVCAYAAKILYGQPCIVVDFGTAITFDVISKKGEYLGGIIVPGFRIALEALYEKTALLPKTNLEKPRELIGRDTKTSILSGIYYGYASLYRGFIRLLSKELAGKPSIVMTGGNVDFSRNLYESHVFVDATLIFKGMKLLYDARALRARRS